MKEVPNVISNKDLLYIKDMLNWNLIMNKKIYSFLDCIEDQSIAKLLTKTMKMHFEHYNTLLDIFD
jgi:hypothetical protein